jgi:hypothetical protein
VRATSAASRDPSSSDTIAAALSGPVVVVRGDQRPSPGTRNGRRVDGYQDLPSDGLDIDATVITESDRIR